MREMTKLQRYSKKESSYSAISIIFIFSFALLKKSVKLLCLCCNISLYCNGNISVKSFTIYVCFQSAGGK